MILLDNGFDFLPLSSVSGEFSFSSFTTRRDACVIMNTLRANKHPRDNRDSTTAIIHEEDIAKILK